MLKEKIASIAKQIYSNIIVQRRYLHMHPELSFKEYNTSAFIKSRLDEQQIAWKQMAGTGIVATIKGDIPSEKAIALRADIDALPIAEKNSVPYVSLNEGVMHACGHDVHTASLLGTAYILQQLKSSFSGIIKLIFQPGEERLPGGASLMIKEGVLSNPSPMAVIGQHIMPSLKKGKIAICSGKFMASMDELYVTVKGKGGHGAQPHLNVDPVVIASHIIIALQQIVSRMAHPASPTVLSFGKVQADGFINVIPDEVYLEGTFRAMDETWREKAHREMIKMATGIAESMGGTCDFKIVKGYPFLYNNEQLAEELKTYAGDYLGEENVESTGIWMAAEDFAYYSQQADSLFYILGTKKDDNQPAVSLHSPYLDVDESVMEFSTGLMAYMALKKLGN